MERERGREGGRERKIQRVREPEREREREPGRASEQPFSFSPLLLFTLHKDSHAWSL
jgi:hypothetical protein